MSNLTSGIQNSLDIQPKTKNAATADKSDMPPSPTKGGVTYRALRGCFNIITEDLRKISFTNGFYTTDDKAIQRLLKPYEGSHIERVSVGE